MHDSMLSLPKVFQQKSMAPLRAHSKNELNQEQKKINKKQTTNVQNDLRISQLTLPKISNVSQSIVEEIIIEDGSHVQNDQMTEYITLRETGGQETSSQQ